MQRRGSSRSQPERRPEGREGKTAKGEGEQLDGLWGLKEKDL